MACGPCQSRKGAPAPVPSVQFVVSGGTLETPEVFDMALTPDSYDLARQRAREVGGTVGTSFAKRT